MQMAGSIAWQGQGPAEGLLVLGFHGTPGSRHTGAPAPGVLDDLGIRYLTFDRPGFGDSPTVPGRRVVDAAVDAAAVLDAAGVDRGVGDRRFGWCRLRPGDHAWPATRSRELFASLLGGPA